MRTKILVPVVLFGCLYAGIASAKGPHAATRVGATPQLHSVRAERPSAAPMRSEVRRAEVATQRSGTSIDRTRTQRHITSPHNGSQHTAIFRQAIENMNASGKTSEAEPVVEGDDGVATSATADEASALATRGAKAREFRAPATVLRPQVWRRRRGKRDRSRGAEIARARAMAPRSPIWRRKGERGAMARARARFVDTAPSAGSPSDFPPAGLRWDEGRRRSAR